VPAAVEALVEQAEDTAAAILAPLFAIAQDRAADLLARVDGKVRRGRSPAHGAARASPRHPRSRRPARAPAALHNAPAPPLSPPPPQNQPPKKQVDSVFGSAIDYSRDLHTKNMGSFAAAKASYFGLIQGLVNAAKAALDPAPYIAGAASTAGRLAGRLADATNPDAVVAAAAGAYDAVAARAPGDRFFGG
jgi:hypothetical protein